jgi:hypothetical protein
MPDSTDNLKRALSDTQGKPTRPGDQPGFVDGIPVEELVRLTRAFTARVTNEDRQRLQLEINESGHQRSVQTTAPFLLQQFFTGNIDLDVELARRYPGSPLLSSSSFTAEPGKSAQHGFAMFSSQDNAAALSVEVQDSGELSVSFLLQSMIAVRFVIGATSEMYRRRFLELIQRRTGIAFLWTRERWERDYLIFVVRDHFVRLYAFGPDRFDGACRLTPEALEQLLGWLGNIWVNDGGESNPASNDSMDSIDSLDSMDSLQADESQPDIDPDTEDSPPDVMSW